MKRRRLPVWLLRDVPALLAVAFSFVPLMILAITSGRHAASEGQMKRGAWTSIARLLAHAEACLDYALWRQAYRSLGWDHRAVTFTRVAIPEGWQEIVARFDAYCDAHDNLQAVLDAYVAHLRAQYGIARRAAHGSTDAALCAAARFSRATSPLALILSSALRARPSKDERGAVHARGPPHAILFSDKPTSQAPPARTHRHAYAVTPPTPPFSMIR